MQICWCSRSQVLDRVQQMGDLFEPVHSLKQKLPKLSGIAEIHPAAAEKGLDIAAQAEDRGIEKDRQEGKGASPPRGIEEKVAQGIIRDYFSSWHNENMAQLYWEHRDGLTQAGSRAFIQPSLPRQNLQYYATQLNAVEVNFTFRQLLKETTAQKWIDSTPAGFRLSVKAHQVITHIKRLKKTEDFVPRFLSTIEPLGRPAN